MATRTFVLTTEVPGDVERVVDFLAALDRHRGLHPFLESAVVVRDEPPVREWAVVEKPGFYRIRFRAVLRRVSPTELHSEVRVPPGVRLDIRVTVSGTTLTETTSVRAPWPLVGYVTRSARLAHARTLRRLREQLS